VTVPILLKINILKHWTIFVMILELMTKEYNANLAKETAYYLRICTLHIYRLAEGQNIICILINCENNFRLMIP
jgi:hypothetical protein